MNPKWLPDPYKPRYHVSVIFRLKTVLPPFVSVIGKPPPTKTPEKYEISLCNEHEAPDPKKIMHVQQFQKVPIVNDQNIDQIPYIRLKPNMREAAVDAYLNLLYEVIPDLKPADFMLQVLRSGGGFEQSSIGSTGNDKPEADEQGNSGTSATATNSSATPTHDADAGKPKGKKKRSWVDEHEREFMSAQYMAGHLCAPLITFGPVFLKQAKGKFPGDYLLLAAVDQTKEHFKPMLDFASQYHSGFDMNAVKWQPLADFTYADRKRRHGNIAADGSVFSAELPMLETEWLGAIESDTRYLLSRREVELIIEGVKYRSMHPIFGGRGGKLTCPALLVQIVAPDGKEDIYVSEWSSFFYTSWNPMLTFKAAKKELGLNIEKTNYESQLRKSTIEDAEALKALMEQVTHTIDGMKNMINIATTWFDAKFNGGTAK
jgi:hypothetical protein